MNIDVNRTANYYYTSNECQLIYNGKERENDILNNTMSAQLYPVKTFFNNENNDWNNMLIFGDNLQVVKKLLEVNYPTL